MVRSPAAALVLALLAGCHRPTVSSTSTAPASAIESSSSQPPASDAALAPDTAFVRDTPEAPAADASPFPFGAPTPFTKYGCPVILSGGAFRSFLSSADTRVAFVDGDDLLALANRSPTGALSPDYAPRDLVDIRDLSPRSPAECDGGHTCLRREAAVALRSMLAAMKAAGMPGRVESAFRGFLTQCWVFDGWARKAHGGFCEATTQSALPGHSQHQLGTTVDMFTSEWAAMGAVFRDGFGCTPGGKWLDESAWKFGFVLPYPIDPDDRKDGSRCATRWDRAVPIDPMTGYKHEPWHVRFIGNDSAARFHDAWLASGPGSPEEITLEQWLRAARGLEGAAELPVCDGCQCGACATMASTGGTAGEKTPCGDASLLLDESGRAQAPAEPPTLTSATVGPEKDGVRVIEVVVHVPAHTPTQPPVTTGDEPTYGAASSFAALVPYPSTAAHRYPDVPGAWRVAIEPSPRAPTETHWPWRASLAMPELEAIWNRANVMLPAKAGDGVIRLRVALPTGIMAVRVTLLRDGAEHGTREVAAP